MTNKTQTPKITPEHLETFQQAYEMYKKVLSSHAYYKVNDHMISEDLVQETYLKTWAYLVKGGKIEKMKAFLYHVLNNLIVDQYRKHKESSLDFLLEKGFEPDFDNTEAVNNTLDGRNAFNLIEKLPESYREVMKMKYVQDLSLEEMSELTGKSRNTLAVRLHRGTQKLKALYESR
jgi:RNA polymerase sigma-70 factor (ECF subfamily)